MKLFRYVISAIALVFSLGAFADGVSSPLRLRIGSYNLHHGAGLDKKLDIERIGNVLAKMNADVIAVQELDSATTRVDGRNELGELSAQLLYHAVYAPTIQFQGGKYGVGLLSRERPLRIERIPLPGKEEPRVLLVAEFRNYVFAATHLSLTEADRLASVEIIERVAAQSTKPFLIAGDWNDTPDSKFLKRMNEKFQICTDVSKPTFPANKPRECIDYIAVYRGNHMAGTVRGGKGAYSSYSNEAAAVLKARVIDEDVASDHRPVFVEAVLPTPAEKLMSTKPYLQNPTTHSMDVMFQTNSVCHCWVEWGVDSLHTQRARTLLDGQEVCYDIENRILLDGLKPATRYFYRVCAVEILHKGAYENHFGDTLRTCFYSFSTPAENSRDFTALIFNDLHDNKACFDALLKLAGNTPYDFVVFNGDCLSEPSNRNHAIDMIHRLTDAVNAAEHPVIFIRGNHEIRNFYSAGMHHLIGYPNDKTYGAFNWGDTRFLVLDCGEDKPDESEVYAGLNDFTRLRADQTEYLKKELKSKEFKKAARRVLISHIGVYANVDDYRPCTSMWAPLLNKQPFDLAVAGHNHKFAFYPNGTDGATFPVLVGDGPDPNNATLFVLQKKGENMELRILSNKPRPAIAAPKTSRGIRVVMENTEK